MLDHHEFQKITLEEYWNISEMFPEHKYEYVSGYIRMMSHGTPAHGQLISNVNALLNFALRESECNVYVETTVELLSRKEDRCYIPDISISCDPHDWTRKKGLWAPTVVVEVLSPGTQITDKTEKLDWYQLYPTIRDILLVDSRRHYIEHHYRMGERSWTKNVYTKDDEIIHLESIEVDLSVREIYLKVWLELEN